MSTTLSLALKRYPTTQKLFDGQPLSTLLTFDVHEIEPIHNAFKPMAREQKFDVSEMAIFTFLQAYAYQKPISLLPVVLAARFQHGCLVYNTDVHEKLTPADLIGKKVGVRAYTQTTGAWVRNILSQEHHLDLKAIKWVTFEDAHLAEYKEPAFVTRATGAKKLLPMLMDGEIDAAILGNDLPDDPKIKAVIPNAAAAGRAWHEATGLLPINHMLVVKNELINTHPALVREVYRCFVDAKNSGKNSGTLDMRPIGFEAITPSLELVVELAYQQEMIPQRYKVADLFAPARALLDL